MIEADLVERRDTIRGTFDQGVMEGLSVDYMQQDKKSFVTYKSFLKYYWSHHYEKHLGMLFVHYLCNG